MNCRAFRLVFGSARPQLEEQLKIQDLRFKLAPLQKQRIQQNANRIVHLLEQNLLTQYEATLALKRLVETFKHEVAFLDE